MCSLLGQRKEEIVIILVSSLWEGPVYSTVFSTLQHGGGGVYKNCE
jgi:hypothetical protein